MSKQERVLLIDRLPNPNIAKNGATTGQNVSGVNVANTGLVRSLLRYGTFDRYLFIQENPSTEKLQGYPNPERLEPVHLGSAERLSNVENLVLFTTSHHLAKYVPVRHFFQRLDWPICGLAHGLSPNFLIPQHVWNRCSALGAHDAVVCLNDCQRLSLQEMDEAIRSSTCLAVPQKHVDGPRYPVIPLGIEEETVPIQRDLTQTHSDSSFVILTIARFSVETKVDLHPFIIGFFKSPQLPDDSLLIVAGDDPSGRAADELRTFAAQFPSKRRLSILPIAAALRRELLELADVALCLSDNLGEAFPLFPLEAMFSGLPVVAPAWNGFRELVEHGQTGFLAPTAFMNGTELLSAFSLLIDPAYTLSQRVIIDVPATMEYLSQLAINPELRQLLGSEARRRVLNRYTWKKIVPQYEALWDEQIECGRCLRGQERIGSYGYYDYGRVFGHKAMQKLDLECVVCPGTADLSSVRKDGRLFSSPPTAGFSSELDDLILRTIEDRSPITLRDLLDRLVSDGYSGQQVLTQTARLLKYGLIDLQEWSKNHGPGREPSLDSTTPDTSTNVGKRKMALQL